MPRFVVHGSEDTDFSTIQPSGRPSRGTRLVLNLGSENDNDHADGHNIAALDDAVVSYAFGPNARWRLTQRMF